MMDEARFPPITESRYNAPAENNGDSATNTAALDEPGPSCKFQRSISMVEMSELSVIREIEDNLNIIHEKEEQGQGQEEESSIDIDDHGSPRDEGRRRDISVAAAILEVGFRRTVSSVDVGALRFQKSSNRERSLKNLVEETTLSSTFSIIPEESEVLEDPTFSEMPTVDNRLDANNSMDTSRHRYNLGLDLDGARPKKALDENDLNTSRHSFNIDLGMETGSDDMDQSRHRYNLGFGLDLDSSNSTCEGLDGPDTLATTDNKPRNDKENSQKNEWQYRLNGPQGKVIKKSKDVVHNDSSIDQDLDDSIHRYKLGIALDPEKAAPIKSSATTKRDDKITSHSSALSRRESPQSVTEMSLTESDNCTNTGGTNATSYPKTKVRKSRSFLLLPSLLRKGSKQQQQQQHQLQRKSKMPMESTEKLKSILKSNSMIDLNRHDRGNSSISEDTEDLSADGSAHRISSPNKMKRVTSFSNVEIREYNITLGDNPGGQGGPPVSLSWEYNRKCTQVVDVDLYEETRPPRRSRAEMYMDNGIRTFRLMREQGFSLQDMRKAAKAAAEIRKQRQKSMKQLDRRETIVNRVSSIFPRKNHLPRDNCSNK